MTDTANIQNKYNDLYVQMRKYLWDYRCVEALADLELSVYQRIPSIIDIRNRFNSLKFEVHDVYMEDEDFKKCFDEFESLINESDQVYSILEVMREVSI